MTPAAADPFLRAVIADPDDDLPRLVYADALDAGDCPGVPRDPERAEFIRTQIELARRTDPHGGIDVGVVLKATGKPQCRCRYCVLRRREQQLLEAHCLDWVKRDTGAPHALHSGTELIAVAFRRNYYGVRHFYHRCVFRRGFVSEIRIDAADWLAHADAILDACPVRRVWRVDDRHPDGHWSGDGLVRLTTWPEWETPVTVGYSDDDDGMVRLRGRFWHHVPTGGFTTDQAARGLILTLLAAEWPGVNFQLPAADVRPVTRAVERMAELTGEAE